MIRHRSVTLAAVSAFIATVIAAGCGGSDDSGFNNGGDGNENPGNGAPGNGAPGSGGGVTNGAGDAGLPGTNPGNTGNVTNCASQTAQATLRPVNLVFMFDKSRSMIRDTTTGADITSKKWGPIVDAAESFYADSQSARMRASLTFFSGSGLALCSADAFSKSQVSLRDLPNSKDFKAAFDGVKPDGGTPSVAAMGGAAKQAQTVAAEHKEEVTAIVLATDGTPEDKCPDGCTDPHDCCVANCDGHGGTPVIDQQCKDRETTCKVNLVASQAKTAKDQGIRTYVIGITSDPEHDKLERLNTVAKSGGTTEAMLVKVNDTTSTKQAFIKALNEIRTQNMSCDFAIPNPPGGGTINYDAVRVNFTNSSNAASTISYSEACAGGNGWHYDDKAAPKKISLCPNSCKTVQGDPLGKINIAFDCKGQLADGGTGGVH
ncbi:VWA domain-containing protein [Pendulispora brunnea]|uniref:VWA domain-containing protein n=1 Tax=Pendulispora brunnea TaxID=2905690 RepID=A0ABZ2JWV9_9BACT